MQVHGVCVTVIVMHRMLRGEMKTDEGALVTALRVTSSTLITCSSN